ncbi:MAG: isoprenylcysteine carboxylmethyltransferase family protein [Peptococcaceae bacterium]|nr:isoprenylcysteine carboxylmethyltransferase family protein [Peptococcaceae bacterium]
MKGKLAIRALTKYIAGLILVALLLFLPAGTLAYRNGWLFIGLLFVPMFFLGLVLLCKAPELLEKRLKSKEEATEQKQVVGLSALMFLAGFILAALDYRFQWTQLSDGIVLTASILLLFSYGMYMEVMRENAYLSRVIEVQENQTVIDTGLYGIIRHPMYSSTIILFLSIPLVLGSGIAFVLFLFYPVLMVKRIRSEEQILEQGLDGYKEYKQKVKYRLIPFIW